MTPEQIGVLLSGRESFTVEFKSDTGPLSDSELVEAVVCLANAQGGTLLIGVEDDGRVTGLHARHRTQPGHLAAFISSRTVPPVSVQAEFVSVPQGIVAVLTVPSAPSIVATSDGKLLTRYMDSQGQPGCRPLYPHEIVGRAANRGQADYTALPVAETTWADLDALEFARLRRMIEENHGDAALLELSNEQIASALGLTRLEQRGLTPTVAGLLLVGKEAALREYLPSHEVAFQVLRGSDVAVNDFHRWPLLRTLEWILEAFQVRNEERELNLGMFRVGVPAYDRRGFREAVNNAFIHREYTRLGAIHMQLHEDHVRVSSPGGFVDGVTPENLLVTEPRPRNPRLADIFKRIGLVERIGRGVAIIYSGQLRNGRLPPSYGLSSAAGVSVVLPGGPADLDFVQLVVAEENRRQRSFSLSELLVLAHLWRERTIDTATAARLIQRSDAETRASLQGLVEAGLVERQGEGQARTYLLSASVYRLLGIPEAYVRARGFEPEQMKQMVVQYTQAHGQISRKDVVELCRVDAPRAYRLLRSLVDEGKLTRGPRGAGRGATYVVSQKRK